MKTLLFFLLVAATASAGDIDPYTLCYDNNCYLNGLRYDFSIRAGKYAKMRAWTLADGAPPVTPQQAYAHAKKRVADIVIPKDFFWQLGRISLEPVGGMDGKWVYVVQFIYLYEGGSSGPQRTMDFVVTMDDELIEPVITPQYPDQ